MQPSKNSERDKKGKVRDGRWKGGGGKREEERGERDGVDERSVC
jgi:hypothetical protein